jgi:acyl-CoA thioester hydrolase
MANSASRRRLFETYRGTVFPWHCDHMGHMNVASYVSKFDEATWHLFLRCGIRPSFLRESSRGMAAVEQRIAYLRELLAGDVVFVRSGLLEVRDRVLRFVHEMRNAETREVSAVMAGVTVHLDTVARRATAFPAPVLAAARRMTVGYRLPWER